jgi:maleylacetoacetate isomerase/maleylpyruvate isomerase
LLDGGQLLTQSLAICEYLDEAYPDTPALLPRLARTGKGACAGAEHLRRHHRCIILAYSSIWKPSWAKGMHRKPDGSVTGLPPALPHWSSNWPASRTYACGDTPGLLDACLVPQVFAARRFGLDLTPYPHRAH